MGFTLPWLDVPVVKITNRLLAPLPMNLANHRKNKAASGVALCADACPADLLPQQLYWFSKGQPLINHHNIADCIECGACAWVCPSNIPLVQYFRQEKAEIAAIRQEEKRAAEAKARSGARPGSEREKAARLERHKSAAVQPAAKDKDAIAAALARVKEKQAQATQPIMIKAGERPDNSAIIAAREARQRKPERNRQNCSKLTTQQPLLIHVKLPLKQLSPAPKRASWNSNRLMRNQNNRSIRAKPPSKPLLPVPKRASWNSNRLMPNQKNRSIRAKPPSKPLLPVPKHASWKTATG